MTKRGWLACGLAAVAFAVDASLSTAWAGLGEAAVARDREALRADDVTTTTMPLYRRHAMTTADGVGVREFATLDGTVFAVDFDGPAMPDMHALLGPQFDRYVAATRAHHGNHHVMTFAEDGLVVTIVRLPRGFTGHAHLPALVPQGVDARALQ